MMRPPARQHGFNLLEVMFAIMILGVGLISIASVFPVASLLQRGTFDEIAGQQMVKSIVAQVEARGFSRTFLENQAMSDPDLMMNDVALLNELVNNNFDFSANPTWPDWLDADRSYPMTGDPSSRPFFWTPLFRKDNSGRWEVYITITRRGPQNEAPILEKLTASRGSANTFTNVDNSKGEFTRGQVVLDNKGNIYTITKIDEISSMNFTLTVDGWIPSNMGVITHLWFARERSAPQTRLPIIRILKLGDEVAK